MSGPKQHYIPQFLLRAFGKKGKGKAVQVTVYTGEGRVYPTATEGAGAERFFYSDPVEDDGAETLDDKITAYESEIAPALSEFRGGPPGELPDSEKVAEVVVHLCVRPAHLRNSYASAAGQLLEDLEHAVADKEQASAIFGFGGAEPAGLMREHLDKAYEENRVLFQTMGISKPVFRQFANAKLDREFEGLVPMMRDVLSKTREQTGEAAKKGHARALEQTLAPPQRRDALARLTWRVEEAAGDPLILPDCIAIAYSAGADCQPLVYTENEEIERVAMPLDPGRLLVGLAEDTVAPDFEAINECFAACSWDYFIARDKNPELELLIPRIGEKTREIHDDVVGSAIGQLKKPSE